MSGDALEKRIHSAVLVVMDEIKKLKEPTDPVDNINFLVVNILFGLCFGGR